MSLLLCNKSTKLLHVIYVPFIGAVQFTDVDPSKNNARVKRFQAVTRMLIYNIPAVPFLSKHFIR